MTTGPLELIRGALQGNSVRWVLGSSFALSDGTTVQQNVIFNVTQDYDRSWPGTVSDRPIEDGAAITDHVRLSPERLSFTIILTPETFNLRLGLPLPTDVDERADLLIAWRDALTVLTLAGKDVIENLVIESMTERKTSDLRDSRMFDITLRQVNIADTDAASEAGVGTRELQTIEEPI